MKLTSLFVKHPDFPIVQRVVHQLKTAGFEVFLAGGCVRDGWLGVMPKDFDVATSATPDQIEKIFPKTVAVGKSFGVVVVVEGECSIEVATFRKEGDYSDGRHPRQVDFCSAKEDVWRRDFTVNALLFDPEKDQIIDHVNGVSDLQNQLVRAVGVPEKRFSEDHLRLLRAIRFSAQLGFTIEKQTWSAIVQKSSLISDVSGERVFEELDRYLISTHVNQVIPVLVSSQLLVNYFHGWQWNSQMWVPLPYHSSEVQRWFYFLNWTWECNSSCTYNELTTFCEKLRFSRALKKEVLAALRWRIEMDQISQMPLGQLIELSFSDSARLGISFYIEKNHQPQAIKKWKEAIIHSEKWKTPPPSLVQARDLPPHIQGSAIGEALRQVYWAQLEGIVKDKQQGLDWLSHV